MCGKPNRSDFSGFGIGVVLYFSFVVRSRFEVPLACDSLTAMDRVLVFVADRTLGTNRNCISLWRGGHQRQAYSQS